HSRGNVKSLWSQDWSTCLHLGFPKHVRQPEDRALAAPTHPSRSGRRLREQRQHRTPKASYTATVTGTSDSYTHATTDLSRFSSGRRVSAEKTSWLSFELLGM